MSVSGSCPPYNTVKKLSVTNQYSVIINNSVTMTLVKLSFQLELTFDVSKLGEQSI